MLGHEAEGTVVAFRSVQAISSSAGTRDGTFGRRIWAKTLQYTECGTIIAEKAILSVRISGEILKL